MRYRLRQLDLDDKMCQQVSLEVFEQVYPREIICEQLSLHQAWEERERSLNMFAVIHLSTSCRSVDATGLPARPGTTGPPVACAGPLSASHAGARLSHQLPTSAVGRRPAPRTLCSLLSAPVYSCDHRSLPLRKTADGSGWHDAGCAGYRGQCGGFFPAQQSIRGGAFSPAAPAPPERMWQSCYRGCDDQRQHRSRAASSRGNPALAFSPTCSSCMTPNSPGSVSGKQSARAGLM